jgi:hypothetical protein
VLPQGKPGSLGAALALALEAAVLMHSPSLNAQEPDSAVVDPERQAQAGDTTFSDTAAVELFPTFPDPASRQPGVGAEWGLPDLLASGSLTFADLVEFTPFLDPVRAGFLEGPQAALFAGRGAASLRFNEDGYEIAPIMGGPLDLRLISLVEQQQIRLIAEPGGYRAYSQTYRNARRQAYSRIDAGTGDRRANVLRAFLSSRVSGALVGFGFDRADTRGSVETGGSQRTVVWGNLSRRLAWGVWGQLEYRGTTVDRDSFPDPKRTDWILRLRRDFGTGWYADLVAGAASLESEPLEGAAPPGGEPAPVRKATSRQVALRGARTGERWQTYLSVRFWDGDGVPNLESEGSVELEAGPASLYASGTYAYWGEGLHTGGGYGSLILDLPLRLRLLAEVEEGDRVLFGFAPIRWFEYSRWSLGLEAKLWSWRLGARGGRWRTTPSPALGQPIDSLASRPGGTVSVGEAWASGRLFRLFGGTVEVGGRYVTREAGAFLYWPQDGWRIEGLYRLLALSGQLEVLITGMGGIRGPMVVGDRGAGPDALVSTGDLSWWRGEVVLRIKDVHVYYNYEIFDSIGVLGEVPGFPLPRTRFQFGVKWEFWN